MIGQSRHNGWAIAILAVITLAIVVLLVAMSYAAWSMLFDKVIADTDSKAWATISLLSVLAAAGVAAMWVLAKLVLESQRLILQENISENIRKEKLDGRHRPNACRTGRMRVTMRSPHSHKQPHSLPSCWS
jgi:ABC-type multidrug transport system fused ATPase/permease subunit